MKKLTLIVSLVLGSLVACGSPPPPESPAVEPAVEPEGSEPEADVDEEVEPDEEEAAPVSELPPREPPRPPCHTLDKSRCSVMQGCEWYEKAGKGECRDE
jgi:hypothetical protein